jgi:hypothetical protein
MWLPIVQRELRLASRRKALYLLRPIAPLVLLIFILGPLFSSRMMQGQEGRLCFQGLASGIFLFALIAGITFSTDTISIERRQGTLPLLQLAGLGNLDIVLGKLSAESIPAFLALVSIFPLLAFPLLFGGVKGFEVARLLMVLLSTLTVALAAGIWGSARSSNQSQALKRCVLVLVGLMLGGGGFAAVLSFFSRPFAKKIVPGSIFILSSILLLSASASFAWFYHYPPGSPFFEVINLVSTAGVPLPLLTFWLTQIITLLGAGVLIISAAAFPAAEEVDRTDTRKAVIEPPGMSVRHYSDPIKWLVLNEEGSRAGLAWVIVLVFLSRGLYFFPALNVRMNWGIWLLATLPSLAMNFILARLSSTFITKSRENGTLEILLTTPIKWDEIIQTQRKVFFQTVRLVITVLIVLEVLSFSRIAATGAWQSPGSALLYLIMAPVSIVSWFAALFWMSLYFALRSKSAMHAAAKAVLWVWLLPLVGAYLLPLLVYLLGPAPFYMFVSVVSRFMHLAIYLMMILWARKRIIPPNYESQSPTSPLSLSWIRMPWERILRVGEDAR